MCYTETPLVSRLAAHGSAQKDTSKKRTQQVDRSVLDVSISQKTENYNPKPHPYPLPLLVCMGACSYQMVDAETVSLLIYR